MQDKWGEGQKGCRIGELQDSRIHDRRKQERMEAGKK